MSTKKNGKVAEKKPAKKPKKGPFLARWSKSHDADVVIVLGLQDGKVVDWEGADFSAGDGVNWSEQLRFASEGAKKFALAEAASGDLGDQVEASAQKLGDAVVDAAFRKLGSLFGSR